MKTFQIHLTAIILVILTFNGSTLGVSEAEESACGHWYAYKDQKCFWVLEKSYTEEDAEMACTETDDSSTIVTIHSADEQNFLSNFLFDSLEIADDFWIGGKLTANKLKWTDGSETTFTNWVNGSTGSNGCAKLIADQPLRGKWQAVSCDQSLRVVCQRPPPWPLSRVTKLLTDSMSEIKKVQSNCETKINNLISKQSSYELTVNNLTNKLSNYEATIKSLTTKQTSDDSTVNSLANSLSNHETSIKNLINKQTSDESAINNLINRLSSYESSLNTIKQNPIPIGFVYVQLSGQPEPKTLWPTVAEWTDVSSTYAGIFFRVLGGNSSSFGSAQAENCPRLTSVRSVYGKQKEVWNTLLPLNDWSNEIETGDTESSNKYRYLKFYSTGGEVRPRNQAVRIWRRTK